MEQSMKRIKQFVEDRDWNQFHSPENLAKSISIEAAELLECFQWNADFDKEQVLDEVADVFIYCMEMCIALHINPSEIIEAKMVKNEKKYPLDKAKGNSTKYTKL